MRHLFLVLWHILKHPLIAANGAREFRLSFTTHYDWPEIESFDAGYELMHMLTLRHFEQF